MGKEKRIRNGRRLFAVLSAVVLAVSALLGRYGLQAYAAGTHTLTHYDTRYNDGPLMVGYFEIDNGTVAMCVCHEMDPPTEVGTALSTVASYTAENQGNELLRKIYYYGWNGPADIGASFVETCLAGSVANGHEDNYYGYGQAFIQKISGRPAAPKGFSVYLLSSGDSTKQTLAYWDYHPTGYVALTKGTEYTVVVKGNPCYSLEGAQYGVYSDASCTKRAAVLTTGAGGKTDIAELDAGKYYVKEIKAPAGYQLDKTVYPVTVEPQETAKVSVKDVPVWEGMELAVHKKDAETGKGLPQGGASLAGAQFTVNFYVGYYGADNLPAKPDRSWVLETKKDGGDGKASSQCRLNKDYLVSGDPLFEVNGKTVLPLGTVTVTETKAPEGYVSEGVIFANGTKEWSGKLLAQVKQDGDSAGLSGGNEYAALEQVIRGDLEFVKVSDGKQERLADIPFRITSKATGESHVIVTDRNGYASTASGWNPHTQNTNAGKTSEDGVWFGTSEPDDGKGALIYGVYDLEELRCKNNEGRNLLRFEVEVYKNHVTVPLGTLTDDEITIGTTARDAETDSHLSAADETVTLIDTVEYEGLQKGKEYKLIGRLLDRDTGEAAVDADGKEITAEKTFTPKKTSGSVEVEFTFDGSMLKEKTVVIGEELWQEDIRLALHCDLEDDDQTIYFPSVGTTALDQDTGLHMSLADETVTVVDSVKYEGLLAGKEYRLNGTLFNQETGEPVKVNGKEITAEKTFVPEKSSGTVEVEFVFDGRELAGKTTVIGEELFYKNHKIAAHCDLKDADQTIYFPALDSLAWDTADKDKVIEKGGMASVTDTVSYSNVAVGKEYKIIGKLMLQETGEPVQENGRDVTAETVFTAESASGSADVTFAFDSGKLKDGEIVVFEKLYLVEDGTEYMAVSHEDIGDKDQTVRLVMREEPGTNPPRTGDHTSILIWVFLIGLSGAAIVLEQTVKRRKEGKGES